MRRGFRDHRFPEFSGNRLLPGLRMLGGGEAVVGVLHLRIQGRVLRRPRRERLYLRLNKGQPGVDGVKRGMGVFLFIGFIVVWLLLQAVILPKLGIST